MKYNIYYINMISVNHCCSRYLNTAMCLTVLEAFNVPAIFSFLFIVIYLFCSYKKA